MRLPRSFTAASRRMAIQAAVSTILPLVQRSPEQNLDRIIQAMRELGARFDNAAPFERFFSWLAETPGARQWFLRLVGHDREQLSTVLKLLFGYCSLEWMVKSEELQQTHGMTAPYSILISPTMRCNLQCRGCYAADYDRAEGLTLREMDDIITQGKELGTHLYTILGGEPFLRIEDLLTLAHRHQDCLFQVFTNGTLITESVIEQLRDCRTIIPVFSINGDREESDYMRGPGVYDQVCSAMEQLRQRNLMFGISLVLTSRNHGLLTSEEFYRSWQERGALFAWNFLYMPVAKNADLSLMPSAEQRLSYGNYIKHYREQHPLFIMDFWADAPSVHGCIAGGRRYVHINHRGDVEPCIFAHFATHSIRRHTLLEALSSPFFTAIRAHQPHTDNLLRPCMIIDRPEILRDVCTRHQAHPTDEAAEALLTDPRLKNHLDTYSRNAAILIDAHWEETHGHLIKDMQTRGRSYPEGLDRLACHHDPLATERRLEQVALHDPELAALITAELRHADSNDAAEESPDPLGRTTGAGCS